MTVGLVRKQVVVGQGQVKILASEGQVCMPPQSREIRRVERCEPCLLASVGYRQIGSFGCGGQWRPAGHDMEEQKPNGVLR